MDAKCPNCEKKAQANEDMTRVKCTHCGYEDTFDAYMERMEERVGDIVTNFSESSTETFE